MRTDGSEEHDARHRHGGKEVMKCLFSLRESQDIDELAGVLYDMLPGSGNPRLSFPTVAQQLGLTPYWTGGSKRPAIVTLLTATYECERHRFCRLIEDVVRQSVSWRAGKGYPLTRDEIENINRILLRLGYKIPGLHDANFLASLERRKKAAEGQRPKDRRSSRSSSGSW